MPNVNLTSAEWDSVLLILREYANMDWPRDPNPFIMHLHDDIDSQVYSQEY